MTRLRKATAADALPLVMWRNADRQCFGDTRPLTVGEHRQWWTGYEQDPFDHLYVIEHDGRAVGTIGIKLTGRAEIHRVLLGDKTLARTGVMSAALAQLTDAYAQPRYWLTVREGNTAAIAFYQRNGFSYAGTDGEYLVMSR